MTTNTLARRTTNDLLWLRVLLIGTPVSFVAVLLVLPLMAVFVEALRAGVRGYLADYVI